MRVLVRKIALSGLVLSLAACGEGQSPETKGEEQEVKDPLATYCNKDNTLGTVGLDIAGNPGDSFRIIMKCGNQEVTRCTATIAQGANSASCRNQGPVPQGGLRTCTIGPGNGNSAQARVTKSGCD